MRMRTWVLEIIECPLLQSLPLSRCRWPGDCLLRAVPFAACSRRVVAPARVLINPGPRATWVVPMRPTPCCARTSTAPGRPPGTGRVHGAWPEPGPSGISEFAVAGLCPALLGSATGGSALFQVQLYKASGRGPAAQNSTSCFIMY